MDLLRTVCGLVVLLMTGVWLMHLGLRERWRERLRGRVEPYL